MIPTPSGGTGSYLPNTSATATPNPPMMECSSAVTMALVSSATYFTKEISNGLIVCIFITRAFIPSLAKIFDVSRHRNTIIPFPMSVTSLPSWIITPSPISTLWSSLNTSGISARPIRK